MIEIPGFIDLHTHTRYLTMINFLSSISMIQQLMVVLNNPAMPNSNTIDSIKTKIMRK